MGVPGLWPLIREKFSRAIKHFEGGRHSGSKATHYDYVYLDANGLLHSAAQLIENYGDKKRKLNPYGNLSAKEKMLKIFDLFFDNIIDVVTLIRPKKVLYIALDGPAPRAKQNQQRERRFIASQLRKIDEDLSGAEKFDSSSISPGTEFMHELSKYMYWKIRQHLQSYGDWRGVNVIYSPPTVPGEGEHKVISFIRSLPQQELEHATHCMFGPDGDLMMLTLSAHVTHMSLFREDQYEPGFVDLVNMGMIRRGLAMELGQYSDIKKGLRTEHDVSNDFVFIGFFVGNDFLPKIKMFYKLSDGLKKMFEIYSETSSQCATLEEECYLTTNGRLNIEALRRFVSRLSDFEEDYIAKQAIITAPDPRMIDHTLLKHSTVTYTGNEQEGIITHIDMKEYRTAYYEHADVHIDDVDKMCEAYLHNLIWVYKYYTNALPSWGDAYEYHYAPLMMDFAKYIEKLTQKDIDRISSFKLQSPALPFEQLLAILSQHSSKLLPEDYRSLMTSDESPLVKAGYYPTQFEIDYEGKDKEFKGVAKLPFVNYSVVSKAYKETAKKSKYVYHRNMIGKVSSFTYKNNGFLADFQSGYGNISDCKVKVVKLNDQYIISKTARLSAEKRMNSNLCDVKALIKATTKMPDGTIRTKTFHNISHLQKEYNLTIDAIINIHYDCLLAMYNNLHDSLDLNIKKLGIITNNSNIDPFIGKGTFRDQINDPFNEKEAGDQLIYVHKLGEIMWKIDTMMKSIIVPTDNTSQKDTEYEYVTRGNINDAMLQAYDTNYKYAISGKC